MLLYDRKCLTSYNNRIFSNFLCLLLLIEVQIYLIFDLFFIVRLEYENVHLIV